MIIIYIDKIVKRKVAGEVLYYWMEYWNGGILGWTI